MNNANTAGLQNHAGFAMVHKAPTTEFFGHHFINSEPLDVGLEWDSLQEAKEYVYAYASRNGFVALTTSTTKDKRHCIMACNRKGSCKSRSKGVRSRRSQKCGCRWHVNIWSRTSVSSLATTTTGPSSSSSSVALTKYRITSAFLKHNHALRNPEETTKIAVKRHSSMMLKQEARAANEQQQKTATSSSSSDSLSPSGTTSPALDQVQYFVQEIQRLAQLAPVPAMVEDMALQLQLLVRTTEHAIQMNAHSLGNLYPVQSSHLTYNNERSSGGRKRKATGPNPAGAAENTTQETMTDSTLIVSHRV